MKAIRTMNPLISHGKRHLRHTSLALASALLVACGSGGGGADAPEAVVTAVADTQLLEGNAGTTTQLEFVITLNKPVVKSLGVDFRTDSTAKVGVTPISTGSATGGSACTVAGTDFVAVTSGRVTIPAGSAAGKLTVTVCGDDKFEPNETLKVVWTSAGAAGGSAVATIVNDDAGGLNGTGATSLLGRVAAFGRDANPLTNSDTDGPLGFAFVKKTGCTDDKVTGLTWQRPDPMATGNYASLDAYVASVNSAAPCTRTDWRVPTVDELLSLMNASSTNGNAPNADRTGAVDAMTDKYWTSESVATASSNAWTVDAANGGAVSFVIKTDPHKVRLVRGGSNALVCNNSDSRFTNFLDGTVEDTKTGLMWKQCPEGGSGLTCGSTASSFASEAAIVAQLYAANANASASGLGYTDWRIPTRNELASLVGRACTGNRNLAAPASIFPYNGGVLNLNFVTATLDANALVAPNQRVWSINFPEGGLGQTLITTPMHLRLVRAGQ
ncbi:hypothetical protein IWX85_003879 [Polaromonas sp. CG_9.11]|nr:hypothetical protein [Polaromonas sp. CG_9.11]